MAILWAGHEDNGIKGFSLIELLIVICMIAILITIASFSWQKYVAKTNLRTGAGKVAADFSMYKAKAISEGRNYTITIQLSPNNNYNISAPEKDDPSGAMVLPAVTLNGVTPTDPAQAQDAQITAVNFAGGAIIIADKRGLVEPLTADYGTITLTNSQGATATITINQRGGVYVTFTNL